MERLSSRQFIELVALIAGLMKGMPQLFVGASSGHGVRAIATGGFVILLAVATALLWWIAVGRVQFSVWRTAGEVTLAFAVADLLGFAFAFVTASIQTNGEYADAYFHAPWGATVPPLVVLPLLLAPGRFLGSGLLVALGRRLTRRGGRVQGLSSSRTVT